MPTQFPPDEKMILHRIDIFSCPPAVSRTYEKRPKIQVSAFVCLFGAQGRRRKSTLPDESSWQNLVFYEFDIGFPSDFLVSDCLVTVRTCVYELEKDEA